tara:strand:+ start:1679 stop:2674 length:996 start_codon:yes stop_codon:yes gene_type:complete
MIKIAQVGFGYWGPNLTRNLSKSKKFDLKILCDLSKKRLNKINQQYPNIQTTQDINDIIIDKSITAVVISTPVKTHFKLIKKLIKSNKNVLVEKPLVTSLKDFNIINKISTKKNLVVMTGYTFLFNDAVIKIKNILKNNILGDVRYVYSQRLNLGRVRTDINAFWNFAPHDLSIINYLLDIKKISKIKYSGKDFVQKGIDDVCFVNFTINDKILYNMHLSWLDPQKTRKLFIVGDKKMLIYDDTALDKIKVINKRVDVRANNKKNMDYDNYQFNPFIYKDGKEKVIKTNNQEPLSKEINHFYNALKNKTRCITGLNFSKKILSQMTRINKI